MNYYEIMTVTGEMREFFEDIPVRRELVKNICDNLELHGDKIVVEFNGAQYFIKIINSRKIVRLWAFTPQEVLDMLYAIAMYI